MKTNTHVDAANGMIKLDQSNCEWVAVRRMWTNTENTGRTEVFKKNGGVIPVDHFVGADVRGGWRKHTFRVGQKPADRVQGQINRGSGDADRDARLERATPTRCYITSGNLITSISGICLSLRG